MGSAVTGHADEVGNDGVQFLVVTVDGLAFLGELLLEGTNMELELVILLMLQTVGHGFHMAEQFPVELVGFRHPLQQIVPLQNGDLGVGDLGRSLGRFSLNSGRCLLNRGGGRCPALRRGSGFGGSGLPGCLLGSLGLGRGLCLRLGCGFCLGCSRGGLRRFRADDDGGDGQNNTGQDSDQRGVQGVGKFQHTHCQPGNGYQQVQQPHPAEGSFPGAGQCGRQALHGENTVGQQDHRLQDQGQDQITPVILGGDVGGEEQVLQQAGAHGDHQGEVEGAQQQEQLLAQGCPDQDQVEKSVEGHHGQYGGCGGFQHAQGDDQITPQLHHGGKSGEDGGNGLAEAQFVPDRVNHHQRIGQECDQRTDKNFQNTEGRHRVQLLFFLLGI